MSWTAERATPPYRLYSAAERPGCRLNDCSHDVCYKLMSEVGTHAVLLAVRFVVQQTVLTWPQIQSPGCLSDRSACWP